MVNITEVPFLSVSNSPPELTLLVSWCFCPNGGRVLGRGPLGSLLVLIHVILGFPPLVECGLVGWFLDCAHLLVYVFEKQSERLK
jgi:hypothetical protein